VAKRKSKKKQKELCAVCQRPVDISDVNTTYAVLMPKGISKEVFLEAFERAEEIEEESPSRGVERNALRMIAVMRNRDKSPEDEEQQVIVGRALMNLGAYLITLHPKCAEEASDAPGEYETEGWRGEE